MPTNEQLAQLAEETGKLQIRLFKGEAIEVEGSDDGEDWHITCGSPVHRWKYLRSHKTSAELESERIRANNAKVEAEWKSGGKKRKVQLRNCNGIWVNCGLPAWCQNLEYRLAPLPTYIPWTADTHPLEPVWVQSKDTDSIRLITFWDTSWASFGAGVISYLELRNSYVRIIETNGVRSTVPCGTLKEGGE